MDSRVRAVAATNEKRALKMGFVATERIGAAGDQQHLSPVPVRRSGVVRSIREAQAIRPKEDA